MGDTAWKWYVGFAPSIGWEMAFQASADLLSRLESKDAPERFSIRRPSKLEPVKGAANQPNLNCVPWMPKYFGAIDKDGLGILSRQLFTWITEATVAAAEDWDKTWEAPSEIIVLEGTNEATNEALAREAHARQELTKSLKNPALKKVK